MLTAPKSRSTPRPMLQAAPSTPATVGHTNLTAKKYDQDTSDADVPFLGLRHFAKLGPDLGVQRARGRSLWSPRQNRQLVRRASTPTRPLETPVGRCAVVPHQDNRGVHG